MKADEHIRRTHQLTDRLMHICRQIKTGVQNAHGARPTTDNRQPATGNRHIKTDRYTHQQSANIQMSK